MRKYKLIKEYPGSPKLNRIIQDTNPVNGAQDAWFDEDWCKPNKTSFILPKSLKPENFPEFWQEVKEKEFEILEFICEDLILESSIFNQPFEGNDTWNIRKVKRISDSVEFQIGDKVKYTTGSITWNIDNFYIRENDNVLLVRSKDNINVETISTIEHVKEPLFKDFLGNELFEGDKTFNVCHKFGWEIDNNRILTKASKFVQDNYKENAAWLYFKYKEDRDKYIEQNKPIYSKKQVLDALNSPIETINYSGVEFILKSRVKEKLGL